MTAALIFVLHRVIREKFTFRFVFIYVPPIIEYIAQRQEMESAHRRLATTLAHLDLKNGNQIDTALKANECNGKIDEHALNTLLFDHLEYRHQVFDFLKDPFFAPRYELGMAGKL